MKILEALRSAEFFAYCKINWGGCEGCDPGNEGGEIAGEVIRNVWAAMDELGEKPRYRDHLTAPAPVGAIVTQLRLCGKG